MTVLFDRRGRVAWGVLAASVVMSMAVSWGLRQQDNRNAARQFDLQAREIVDSIKARLRQHEQILLGGAGLFDASGAVSRRQWRSYVERLRLHSTNPGIQGVGFSQVIRHADLRSHVAAVRAEGFPDYAISPQGDRELYTSIVYLEPFIGRNLAAFGYDMFAEPVRNRAMRRAAETGNAAMSGKVRLVQETHGREQAGFLMYVPVYARGLHADTVGTPAARWQALRGFVYSPFRMDDLMRGILGEYRPTVDFFIHDGTQPRPDALMYSSADEHGNDGLADSRFTVRQTIDVHGNPWTVSLYARPGFVAQFRSGYEWLVLVLGCGISLALFALTWSLVGRRERALALAGEMTAQIRDSEQRFRDILETCPTAARIALAGGHRVIFHNRRYAELINVAAGQAAGVDPAAYYARREDYEDVLAHLGRGEPILDRLVELAIPGHGTKWALASYFPLQHEGQAAVLGWFHDITRQREAEDEIRRSRKLLADVLEAASEVSVIATDAAGLITIFNRGAENLLGYSAAEMVGRQTPAIIHLPAEVAARGRELTAMLGQPIEGFRVFVELPKRQGAEHREWTYVRKDGSQVPVSLVVTAMRGAANEILGYLGIAEDISERKRNAAELTRLSLVASQTTNGVIIADANGLTEWVNAGFVRITGYTLEDLRGRTPGSMLQGPATDQRIVRDIKAALRNSAPFHVELINYTKSGKPYWIEINCNPLRDAAGALQGFMAIETDISERKAAEIALQEQARHTQAILDNAADGIITIDTAGSIVSFNQAAERIFGYAAGEVIGCNISRLMPEPHRSAHDGYLERYVKTGVAHIIGSGREFEGQRSDGNVFPMDLSVSEISHTGGRMFVGLVRDITERKRIDRMKNEFVSTVSHELRTPLTSISGSLGLLAGGAMGTLPEQAKALIDIAHRNSLRLSHLINDLLDMEKIAAGKMQFDMRVQPLMPLIEQAIEANRGYAGQHQVSFVLAACADAAEVHVDAGRLIQILSNFLSNAAKFSPAGSTVEIAARRLSDTWRVDVTDHGPGIPADFHDRIFQKFSQADSSDTRQKGGTGLGLAITKELAERMGGRVGFVSTEGRGATFFCDLPVAGR